MALYGNTSPYAKTALTAGYLDILNFIDIPAYTDDVQFMITSIYMHRPDLLAYDLYKDATLWWVFTVRNKDIIIDPIYDFVPGQLIYLPKLPTIQKALHS